MRDQIYIEEIGKHVGQEVLICGWLYNRREKGKIQFLIIRDGTGIIQGVVTQADGAVFEEARALTQESSLQVRGTIREDQRAPGGYELQIKEINRVQRVEGEYPIALKEHGPGFLLDHRHLWIRTPRQAAILRVRHEVMQSIRDFFDQRGFIATEAPILTPSACEGTTTLFEVDYFEDKAYLSQSGQLYLEATAMALGKVYWIGPAFRAERSKTRKHLTEFWMAEAEVAFCEHEENLKLQEDLVKYVIERALARRARELKELERKTEILESILHEPFARVTYEDSLKLVNELLREKIAAGEVERLQWGEDFGAPHEEALGAHFGRPVFVEFFPAKMKAFYMEPKPDNPELVLAADLVASEGYGEIIGGSQRISDINLLRARLREFGLPEEPYTWYIDLRQYGGAPHAGFGLGVERLTSWIAGIEHLREAIPFPRMLYRLRP
ncbi:asparagine--tRNA ligase [Candidatus Acetothermia bacterium]|jgi:asparaginyl-tRNA synthetase|nr:asparagine--tRNA ligase [Candidatus Acetothermia bacterium]MCI2431402.1 asparagine--tRNA ligase [Candidatus Acetothermia bacterium]MCI2437278.1 asparagine--tRNA ligase [Candidatus Acetothermia bacterium]